MQSLKSRAVALVLRHTRKKAFRSAENMNSWIARARTTETHRPPLAVARRVDITRREVASHRVYEVEPRELKTSLRLIYFHGGAYVFEITPYHWRLIAELAERLGARVTVPIYPLAPEHRFETMFDMALETYRSALAETPAESIAFVGDSAGGNMAVVLTMMAAEAGLPAPGSHVLISPGLDMTLENPEVIEAERRDPWLGIPGGLEAIRHYAPHIDRADWRISPIKGALAALPKTLILAGSLDMLTPDSVRFADLARQAGADVEIVVEAGMVHVWPLIDMPEARRARDRIVEFLKGMADLLPARRTDGAPAYAH